MKLWLRLSLFFFCIACIIAIVNNGAFAGNRLVRREYYQVLVYHYSDASQETRLDTYFRQAFIPAAHRLGIARVGVFKPLANDTAADKTLYVFMPFPSLEHLYGFPELLERDVAYREAAKDYLDAAYSNPPYRRIASVVLKAFPLAPVMRLPQLYSPLSEHIYELRSYESATEKLHRSKVEMFNEGGETVIFSRLQFNPVFYADVLSGGSMPNLMYMTSFNSREDRDAHWKSFGADPAWKTLSALPQYQHNVSRSEIILMRAAVYSDL
jgi:hypothetical protein